MRTQPPAFARWVKDLTTKEIRFFYTPDRQQMHLGHNYHLTPEVTHALLYSLEALKRMASDFTVHLEKVGHENDDYYALVLTADQPEALVNLPNHYLVQQKPLAANGLNSVVSEPDLLDIIHKLTV